VRVCGKPNFIEGKSLKMQQNQEQKIDVEQPGLLWLHVHLRENRGRASSCGPGY